MLPRNRQGTLNVRVPDERARQTIGPAIGYPCTIPRFSGVKPMASATLHNSGIQDTKPEYRWTWKKGHAALSVFDYEIHESVMREFHGWTYGNVILWKHPYRNGWYASHIPTGLGLGASWDKLGTAKTKIEQLHNAIGLDSLDTCDSWDETRNRHVRSIVISLKNNT